MITREVQRCRRVVQVIAGQLRQHTDDVFLIDADQVDLLWYQLAQLREAITLSGLGIAASGLRDLPTGDAVLDHGDERPPGWAIRQLAITALNAARHELQDVGADPDGSTLDTHRSRRDEVVAKILEVEGRIRKLGVAALYLFGSVARGDDGPECDVDVAIDIAPEARENFSLFDLGGIQMDLIEKLEIKVDLVERSSFREQLKARVEVDLLRVF